MEEARRVLCPECKSGDIERICADQQIDIRGEKIKVPVMSYYCNSCKLDFENLNDENDYLDKAYKIYREIHNMLQPKEIKKLRISYDLTQTEMARLLGWGDVTLARYEKGALQDHAHDRALRFLLDPKNMYALLEQNPGVVDRDKFMHLRFQLEVDIAKQLEKDLVKFSLSYSPDKLSGFSKFSFEKFINMVLFFCKGGVLKTKLNKLLFYADFKHFKKHGGSISGARYIHATYGPVPKFYNNLLAYLIENNLIDIEEIKFGKHNKEEIVGEEYRGAVDPDLNLFSDTEKQNLIDIKKYFSKFGSKQISEFSHKEPAYKLTQNGEVISYEYAANLQI